jgi:vancomycin permeability regulator SanA
MVKKMILFTLKTIFWVCVAGFVLLAVSKIYMLVSTAKRIKTLDDARNAPAAVVFGAGLRRDGSPTLILEDRVETAVQLYKSGKVKKLLMSGDNRFLDYNEPASMRQYAIGLGVPEEDIVLDYAGRSTYDTCYRARAIFGLNQAILVTQSFHLPRAIYTCSALGMDVTGVKANLKHFQKVSILYWNFREVFATLNALWDVHVSHPLPVLGDQEPIFPNP